MFYCTYSPFTKITYTLTFPLPLWNKISELSEMLLPKLLILPPIILNLHLPCCVVFKVSTLNLYVYTYDIYIWFILFLKIYIYIHCFTTYFFKKKIASG